MATSALAPATNVGTAVAALWACTSGHHWGGKDGANCGAIGAGLGRAVEKVWTLNLDIQQRLNGWRGSVNGGSLGRITDGPVVYGSGDNRR